MIVLKGGFHCLSIAWFVFICTLLWLLLMSIRSQGSHIHNTANKWVEKVVIGSTPAYRLHKWPSRFSVVNSTTEARVGNSIPAIPTAGAVTVSDSVMYRHQLEYHQDLLRLLAQVGSESKKRGIQIDENLLVAAIIKLKTKHNYPKNSDGSWKVPEEYVLGEDGKVRLTPVIQRVSLRGAAEKPDADADAAAGEAGDTASKTANAAEAGAEDPAKTEPGQVFDSTTGAMTALDSSAYRVISLLDPLNAAKDAFLNVENKMKRTQHLLKAMEREKERERKTRGAGRETVAVEPKHKVKFVENTASAASAARARAAVATAILLSAGRPATSDVRGNLGPASVITSEKTADWLRDRWQAASDMGGTPIPGPHWVEVDLQRLCKLSSILIDWEEAFSQHWTVKGKRSDGKCAGQNNDGGWTAIARSKEAYQPPGGRHTPKHILQTVLVRDHHTGSGDRDDCSAPYYDKVRLMISKPSTRFGSSIWRLQVYGQEPSEEGKRST